MRATLGAILGCILAYSLGCDGPTCAVAGALAAVSVRIALIDFKLRIIHDGDIFAMAAVGTGWIVWSSADPTRDFLIALLRSGGYATMLQGLRLGYMSLRGRDGLGFGDVKLVAAAGPLLAFDAFSLAVAGAAIAGIVFSMLRTRIKDRPSSQYTFLPLGCFLSPAINASWLISVCPIT